MKSAALIRDTDTFTKMDPFCTGTLVGIPPQRGSVEFKSKVHNGAGKAPVWNEKFEMYVFTYEDTKLTEKSGLTIKVCDEDVASSDVVGETSVIPFKDILNATLKSQTVKILHDGKEAGTVTFEAMWKSLKRDKNAKEVIYNGTINLLLKNAVLTRDLDTFTKMDPQVEVDLKDWPITYRGPKYYKSKVLDAAGKTPAWNEKI